MATTRFSRSAAEACLFDPDLWEKTARAAAEEAAQDGIAMTFAPMLDVARDPRWGRIVEGPGEDPWGRIADRRGQTRGFQGQDSPPPIALLPRPSTFAPMAQSQPAANMPRLISPRERVHEIYLPPFSAAVAAGTAAMHARLHLT